MNTTIDYSFSIRMKVLHKETNKGLVDLLVVLLDLDSFADPENGSPLALAASANAGTTVAALSRFLANYSSYNRLYSGLTDTNGEALATVKPRDFNNDKADEKKPDLVLLVLAPEEPGLDIASRILYLSNDFRVNAGSSEAYIVRLDSALLVKKGLPIPSLETDRSVKERIAAYQKRVADDHQFDSAVLALKKTKLHSQQTDFARIRSKFKSLLVPLPINAVGSGYATYVAEGEKVKNKFAGHYNDESGKVSGKIERHVAANKGIEVSFVLNGNDRQTLGFDPNVLHPAPSGTLEFNKTFTNIQADPVFKPILAKMNASGADNVVMTSNNPILKQGLSRSTDTQSATESLGMGIAGLAPVASRVLIGFSDLPAPAQNHLNGNNGGNANVVAVFRLTDSSSQVRYEVRLLADIVLHFDGDGINTDDHSPMTSADIATYVKKALTDVRSLNIAAQTSAGKSNQAAINDSVNNFSLRKGPAELPSFYDFQVLNIAFGHIWQQLTDDQPAQLASQAVTHASARGFALSASFASAGQLLSELYTVVGTMSHPPESVISNFDVTFEEWNALELQAQKKLSDCSTAIDHANMGLIFRPGGQEVVRQLFAQTVVPRPAGYYNVRSAEAAQFAQKLKNQGELLVDYVRNGNGKSFHKILSDLDAALKTNYAFTIFGADDTAKAINFGLLNTYRQKWEPVAYQVGNLVKSIPLAPKEERKYSLKTVFTRKRTEKEAKKNNQSLVQEQNTTSRAEEEIIAKAQSKNTFNLAGEASYGSFKVTSSLGMEASKESASNRKDFRESVIKATQEFKEERSVELDTEQTYTGEVEESGTITNPNDELAVTYLFYELQKRFKVSEQLYRLMPTVLVAQDVPSPKEITEAWVIAHDWVINRAILDDSFRPALAYLSQKNVGDDFAIRELRKNLRSQRQTVDALKVEFAQLNAEADNRYAILENTINQRIGQEKNKEGDNIWDSVGEFFGADSPTPEAAKAREMAARDSQAYAADKAQKMSINLQREMNMLGAMTAEYTKVMREHLDNLTKVERLLLHIKENILYYMQAIWEMEPPDQRYMRLMNIDVPQFEISNLDCVINQQAQHDLFKPFRQADETLHKAWINPRITQSAPKPLVEVANLDNILGFRGNYLVFPMKQHNALTEIMAMPYVDASFGAMDPDQLSNVSLEDYARHVCYLRDHLPADEFEALKEPLKAWLKMLLEDPLRNGDEIIVPTGSLYIEMLLSANTLLEDFKLFHREWDVYKVQGEVQLAALENLRLSKRILQDKLDDPKIDKTILVQGGALNPRFDVDPP